MGRATAATDEALKAAIKSFERAAAMPVTGLATRPLLAAVHGESRVVTGKLPRTPARRKLTRHRSVGLSGTRVLALLLLCQERAQPVLLSAA